MSAQTGSLIPELGIVYVRTDYIVKNLSHTATMPSRAPSYYHWSIDKPCTTNQVYGYEVKQTMVDVPPRKTPGPFDYTRPFSNSAFFPQISSDGTHLTSHVLPTKKKTACPTSARRPATSADSKPRFELNRGYVMGHTPVVDKVVRASLPAGVQLDRSLSAPPKIYKYPVPKAKEIFLWHTLAGSLVHVKNYPPQVDINSY